MQGARSPNKQWPANRAPHKHFCLQKSLPPHWPTHRTPTVPSLSCLQTGLPAHCSAHENIPTCTFACPQDADRVESGKAAAVAGAAGTLASLPFVLSDAGTGLAGVLTLGGVAVSCLLFGVTYRYAVRQDLANPHLKVNWGGTMCALGGWGMV